MGSCKIGDILIVSDLNASPNHMGGIGLEYPAYEGYCNFNVGNSSTDSTIKLNLGDMLKLIYQYAHYSDQTSMICLYSKEQNKTAVFYESRIGMNFKSLPIN